MLIIGHCVCHRFSKTEKKTKQCHGWSVSGKEKAKRKKTDVPTRTLRGKRKCGVAPGRRVEEEDLMDVRKGGRQSHPTTLSPQLNALPAEGGNLQGFSARKRGMWSWVLSLLSLHCLQLGLKGLVGRTAVCP